jgi:hypothetical protein
MELCGPERVGRAVWSKKQAIAIGLSEARKKGAKVPRRGKSYWEAEEVEEGEEAEAEAAEELEAEARTSVSETAEVAVAR